MYRFAATIQGTAPLLFGGVKRSEIEANERAETFELRTWRERLNVNKNNEVIMSGYALKSCVIDAAGYLGEKIKGAGQKTWAAKFAAAFRSDIAECRILDADGSPIKPESVQALSKFVPSDGKTGSGKRVWRFFPILHEWQIQCVFIVTDEIIESERVMRYLQTAGAFKGLGTWRPSKRGDYGTFCVVDGSTKVTEIVL